jgi:Zn-finger nucleic acid-binding protein
MDEKDRLGTKLREKEKAEEDRYFAQRDRELIEKLKQSQATAEETELRQQAHMRCPKCGEKLSSLQYHEVTVEECPACKGMWLDRGELETLAQRERGLAGTGTPRKHNEKSVVSESRSSRAQNRSFCSF